MSRRQNALLVLMLVAPLTGGTCSFSSSSGGSKIVVTTDDCTPEEERAGECETTPDPPEATLAGTSGRSDASAWSTSMPETMGAIRPAPAVPEPSAALLFLIGAALVSARRPC